MSEICPTCKTAQNLIRGEVILGQPHKVLCCGHKVRNVDVYDAGTGVDEVKIKGVSEEKTSGGRPLKEFQLRTMGEKVQRFEWLRTCDDKTYSIPQTVTVGSRIVHTEDKMIPGSERHYCECCGALLLPQEICNRCMRSSG